jgi:hypothetical protein
MFQYRVGVLPYLQQSDQAGTNTRAYYKLITIVNSFITLGPGLNYFGSFKVRNPEAFAKKIFTAASSILLQEL